MAKVVFLYKDNEYKIQCQENQKLEEICDHFISKLKLNEKDIYYSYNGKSGSIFDKNLTFEQMANSLDKERKKMNILAMSYDNDNNDKVSLIRSKNIICPKCGELIKMKIDNYKIKLFECKNNHSMNDIPLNHFEKTQMINLKNIVCEICKETNKNDTFDNQFYRCSGCKLNMCPICKSKHNQEHKIYNYDKINYICNIHDDEPLTHYCNLCKKNLCSICIQAHLDHDKILLANIIPNKNELLKQLEYLKNIMNMFTKNINKIIEILNEVKEAFSIYYNLEEYMITNFEQKERNYEILYNINEIINSNKNVIENINEINNENIIKNKFTKILNLYEQISVNEIKIKVKIEKRDINKEIYFLDNTDGKYKINGKKEEYHHDLLKELNESNVKLYINNKEEKYKKYFIPKVEGIYLITLKLNILMTDCSFMFYKCENITGIDLSLFNSKNVTNMQYMFNNCTNLLNVNLSSLNTENVTNMYAMFNNCYNLTSINLSSFNTKNVTNMRSMFNSCYSLTDINISSFNTENVNNMEKMFGCCYSLKSIDISNFDTQKVKNMERLFGSCKNLENINISKFDIQNTENMESIFDDCPKLSEIKLNKNSEKIKEKVDLKSTRIVYI